MYPFKVIKLKHKEYDFAVIGTSHQYIDVFEKELLSVLESLCYEPTKKEYKVLFDVTCCSFGPELFKYQVRTFSKEPKLAFKDMKEITKAYVPNNILFWFYECYDRNPDWLMNSLLSNDQIRQVRKAIALYKIHFK